MEKQSFKERIKSMSVKRKIASVVIILLIVAIPVGAVAYQLNHKKTSKSASKSGKSSSSSKDSKSQASAGSNSNNGDAPAPQSRLERFNKDELAKRITQALDTKRITDAQAKALNKKLAEIDKFVSANKSKSNEEQSKAASDKRKELSKWAKDNNIPNRYIVGWL